MLSNDLNKTLEMFDPYIKKANKWLQDNADLRE
jgi:hypothetical protein